MPVIKTDIEHFLESSKEHPVIDVRSPVEFKHAHIPGAYNLPLFSDEERKIVGTTYKLLGREKAIKAGLEFFGPRMTKIVEEAETLNNKTLLVHCWRGGMRSEAIAWLLNIYGFKIMLLSGGYKKFRRYVLDTFNLPFQFKILGGYTGSGKTGLLKELKQRGENIIDLENLAGHKGSAFGNIGMPNQPGQEMFENLLALELRQLTKDNPAIWVEDESQRIGLINLPHELWKTIRISPLYFLEIPFEIRLDHVVQEYGELDPEKLVAAIERISQKLGNLNAKNAILLLKEGKTRESFEILLSYYDRAYLKALHNRESVNTLLHTIECKSITPENASQLAKSFHPEKI